MDIDSIISVAEQQGIHVFADPELDHEFAYYIPEAPAIGINPKLSDEDASCSVIHELAHHIDLQHHPFRADIDGEVIAFACEELIYYNAPLRGVIDEVEPTIRELYNFEESIMIDEDDILEVADQLRAIISNN